MKNKTYKAKSLTGAQRRVRELLKLQKETVRLLRGGDEGPQVVRYLKHNLCGVTMYTIPGMTYEQMQYHANRAASLLLLAPDHPTYMDTKGNFLHTPEGAVCRWVLSRDMVLDPDTGIYYAKRTTVVALSLDHDFGGMSLRDMHAPAHIPCAAAPTPLQSPCRSMAQDDTDPYLDTGTPATAPIFTGHRALWLTVIVFFLMLAFLSGYMAYWFVQNHH